MKINTSVQFVLSMQAERKKKVRFIYTWKSIKRLNLLLWDLKKPHVNTDITMQRAAVNRLSCSHRLLHLNMTHWQTIHHHMVRCVIPYNLQHNRNILGHYNSFVHIVNTVCKVSPENNNKNTTFVWQYKGSNHAISKIIHPSVLATLVLEKYKLFWIAQNISCY